MLFVSSIRSIHRNRIFVRVSISESRCFSFQVIRIYTHPYLQEHVSISESRCFSFQEYAYWFGNSRGCSSFNLGIEMLFVSSEQDRKERYTTSLVSISESRCFSFQADAQKRYPQPLTSVSISESRCFSFQVPSLSAMSERVTVPVSISESRCFSFQAGGASI